MLLLKFVDPLTSIFSDVLLVASFNTNRDFMDNQTITTRIVNYIIDKNVDTFIKSM